MPALSMKPVVDLLQDGAADPDIWQEVLPVIAQAADGIGAACFMRDDRTNAVEWAYIAGPLSDRTTEFIEYYSDIDLFTPLIAASQDPGWKQLSGSLPEAMVSRSEWYQDFVRPSGLVDVIGAQLYQAGTRRIFFGIHFDSARMPVMTNTSELRSLLGHLEQTARSNQTQRMLNLEASVGTWALDHLGDALFVVYGNARVAERNAAAERVLSPGHALSIRKGRLVAIDPAEAQQLAALIASASKAEARDSAARRILLGGASKPYCQLVTLYPLQRQEATRQGGMVVVRVVDLSVQTGSNGGLAGLFGFSPAEARLSEALMQGRTLKELTQVFGVRMPTLRAQLRSIMRKSGVQRQVDLMRLLLRVC